MVPVIHPDTHGGAATEAAVPFVRDLARHGHRTALVTPDGELTYQELAERVDRTAGRLGPGRRLLLVAGANTTDALVTYLAGLAAGHPVLLAPGERPEVGRALTDRYDPDVVAGDVGGGWEIRQRRAGSVHQLHPELALLLCTSGSTGSAKLVRLSAANLQANADAIADYLDLQVGDRAATTLPVHYCYGLSVVHSHLSRGASLLLTDRSVVEPEFWEEFRAGRATSFAGVPYTFDLLDRVGFDRMHLPDLRYVTQAGGALAPERVRRYAALGRAAGWRLFVMYGQTEATARMAYLPPELAEARPDCIGVPIPGGAFRLEPVPEWPEPDTGELVYRGPNVMLGYATASADLALGRTVHELRTGDIGRRTPDGLYQVVGRRGRFAKVFGLRIDLQQVETELAGCGWAACGVAGDGELVVAVEHPGGAGGPGPDVAAQLRGQVARRCGLPGHAVRVGFLPALPRLPSGKPDYPAVRRWAAENAPEPAPATAPAEQPAPEPRPGRWRRRRAPRPAADELRQLFADVLGVSDVTEDSSFAGLGGDSLSYVALSVRLERLLGALPDRWHELPIRQLRRHARPVGRRRSWASLDTSVALRAVSIVLIVGTHATLFGVAGGAHLLMGVAGFNFARFQLAVGARHFESTTSMGLIRDTASGDRRTTG